MTFTCWIGLKRLCSLSAIQASTASTIISYLLIFFALLRISILSGLRVNQSLFIGTASMIWGTMGGAVLYFLGADPYFGAGAGVAFSGAFYHNATQLHSTTIGLVGLAMVLEYYNERRSQWLYLAALLIGSSLHFKPSFFTIIPFSLLLLFLITKQYKRLEWYFCAAILAFFVVLWILPKFFFPLSPNPMQVDFEPFYKQLSLFPNHAWTVRK